MKKKKSAQPRVFLRWIAVLAALSLLLSGLALCMLCLAEANPPPVSPNSGAIIVLGCQVYADGTPSVQLEYRLQTALEEYLRMPRLIIVCGGQGSNEPTPEGQIMEQWLLDHNVPSGHVLADTTSGNTRQNLEYAKALLPDSVESVTIVTSNYHLPRALAIARDAGLTADGIGAPIKQDYWLKNHAREVLAWGKYLLQKVFPGN